MLGNFEMPPLMQGDEIFPRLHMCGLVREELVNDEYATERQDRKNQKQVSMPAEKAHIPLLAKTAAITKINLKYRLPDLSADARLGQHLPDQLNQEINLEKEIGM
jgi:hypothetical protein